MKKIKTITDHVCPKCGSTNTYQYDVDECEFDCDGIGHYDVDIHCKDCGKDSRVYYKFKYELV
jgi:RNase P subunit RPR2